MNQTPPTDLERRVSARKQELISEILEHKKNSSRAGASEAVDKIKERLTELTQLIKEGVVDGWANVAPRTKVRLDEWISK